MKLQDKIKQFRDGITDITENLYHFPKDNMTAPYIVWQESGANTLFTNNLTAEHRVNGILGYYTTTEYDPMTDTIQEALQNMGCSWKLQAITYEAETQLIHYEWKWEL